jgi:hypothetical protein
MQQGQGIIKAQNDKLNDLGILTACRRGFCLIHGKYRHLGLSAAAVKDEDAPCKLSY